jgi:PEP-CTERM motif-containing protein
MRSTRSTPVSRGLAACLILAVLALAAGEARASITMVALSPINNGNGTWTYNYQVNLSGDENANTGDFATLYDFTGLQGTPTLSGAFASGWQVNLPFLGQTPNGITPIPADDPAVVNIFLSRTGATILGNGTQQTLFDLQAISTIGPGIPRHAYSSLAHVAGDPTGATNATLGTVSGPAFLVPEPTSLALFGIGGAALVAGWWRKRFASKR